MGWLEIILLGLGATILAANQLMRDAPNITARFPALSPRGWWNYVPFGLMMLAGVIYLGRLAMPDESLSYKPQPQSISNKTQPSPAVATAPGATPMQASAVIEGIPVNRLVGSFEGRTEVEADRMIAPFVGAPVQVQGTVSTVDGPPGRRTVWLSERPVPSLQVSLWLSENQDAFAERLQVNDRIRAQCELVRLSRSVVNLRRCVFYPDLARPLPPLPHPSAPLSRPPFRPVHR